MGTAELSEQRTRSGILEAEMSRLSIRFAQLLMLAAIGTGFLPDPSFADVARMVKQMCDTAKGTFIRERNGKFSCIYPSEGRNGYFSTIKNCTAQGDCEYVLYCGGRICDRFGKADPAKNKSDKGPKPKPIKLEGPTTVTAGTAGQRGLGTSGAGTTGANTPAFGGSIAPASSAPGISTGAVFGASTAPATERRGTAKADAMPSQLAERLRRLQQQQR
jgi:hypothetical protein